MKRILCLLLAASMAVALVACGGSQSDDKNSPEEKKASDSISSAPVSSEAAQEADKSAAISSAEAVESIDIESAIPEETNEPHLYDHAYVKPMMNGTRTERIGEYSVIKADSSECTEGALADWYYNYVSNNDFNYSLIVYTDKDEKLGCYATETFVQKDVGIQSDEYGDYYLGDTDSVTTYGPSEDGETLTVYQDIA